MQTSTEHQQAEHVGPAKLISFAQLYILIGIQTNTEAHPNSFFLLYFQKKTPTPLYTTQSKKQMQS